MINLGIGLQAINVRNTEPHHCLVLGITVEGIAGSQDIARAVHTGRHGLIHIRTLIGPALDIRSLYQGPGGFPLAGALLVYPGNQYIIRRIASGGTHHGVRKSAPYITDTYISPVFEIHNGQQQWDTPAMRLLLHSLTERGILVTAEQLAFPALLNHQP